MKSEIIYIKNMVCPRCIDTVQDIFNDSDIKISHIELGKVSTNVLIDDEKKHVLKVKLEQKGFELLEDKPSQIITQIKTIVIEQVHYSSNSLHINFSTFLSEKLQQDYTSLSKLFSSIEGITIEKYILKQKIEKIKELIVYDELNLSEIAFQLNYSSAAHLSSQFKKETGMPPSEFKKLKTKNRNSLDAI